MHMRYLATMALCMLVTPLWAAPQKLEGHKRAISHLAVSADGKRAFTRDFNHKLILWDLVKGVPLQEFNNRQWLRHMAISPKGERALTVGLHGKFWLYKSDSNKPQLLPFQMRGVFALCFVGPDRLLVSAWRKSVIIDLAGKVEKRLPQPRYNAAAATPDGRVYAVAKKATLELYSGRSHKRLARVTSPSQIQALAVDAAGKQLASGGKDGEIRLYAVDQFGQPKPRIFFGHRKAIKSLFFANTRTLVSASKWLVQWDTKTGRATPVLRMGWKTRTAGAAGGKLLYPLSKTLLVKALLPTSQVAASTAEKSLWLGARPKASVWLPPNLFPTNLPMLDGSLYQVVVGDGKGQVHLLRVHIGMTTTIHKTLLGKVGGPVTSIALNRTTKQIAIANGHNGQVAFWHLPSKARSSYKVMDTAIESIDFTPDGKELVAGSRKGEIVAFDPAKQRISAKIHGHTRLHSLRAIGGKETFLLVKSHIHKPWTLQGLHSSAIYRRIALSGGAPVAEVHKSGHWAITGGHRHLNLHDLQGQKERSFRLSLNGKDAALDPGLRFAAVSLDKGGSIELMQLTTGKVYQRHQIQWSGISHLSLSDDGRVLLGFRGYRVWFVPLLAPPKAALSSTPLARLTPWNNAKAAYVGRTSGTIHNMVFHKSQQAVFTAGYFDSIVKFRKDGTQTSLASGWGSKYAVAISADGRYIAHAGKRRKQLNISDFRTQRHHLLQLKGNMRHVSFSADGKQLALGTDEGKIFVFETKDWKQTHTLSHGTRNINAVAFHPDGHQLTSSSDDDHLIAWNLRTGKRAWSVKFDDDVNDVAYSPDGTEIAAIHEDGKVVLLNTQGTIRKQHPFGNRLLDGNALAYRPDGRILAAGFEKGILGLIDRNTDKITLLRINWNDITALTWASNGDLLAAFGSLLYRIPMPSGIPPYVPPVRTKGPFVSFFRGKRGHAHFNAARQWLVLAKDGTITAQHSQTGKTIATYTQAPTPLAGLTTSPKGDWLLAWDTHGKIVLWQTKTKLRTRLATKQPIAHVALQGVFLAVTFHNGRQQVFRYDPHHKETNTTQSAAPQAPARRAPAAPKVAPKVAPKLPTPPTKRMPAPRKTQPAPPRQILRRKAAPKRQIITPRAATPPGPSTKRSAPAKDGSSPLPEWD